MCALPVGTVTLLYTVKKLQPDKLVELYGEQRGRQVRYAEAFEICEYGRQPDEDEIRRLFPFFPDAE